MSPLAGSPSEKNAGPGEESGPARGAKPWCYVRDRLRVGLDLAGLGAGERRGLVGLGALVIDNAAPV